MHEAAMYFCLNQLGLQQGVHDGNATLPLGTCDLLGRELAV